MILSGCQSLEDYEPGKLSEETGQLIIDSADAANETLDQSPGLDQATSGQIRTGIGLYRLAGELLLGFGLLFQMKRRKDAEDAIIEIDESKDTPSAKNQASSTKSKKAIKKITG